MPKWPECNVGHKVTCGTTPQCDHWGMKLNASKTKTMIVSRSCTMHSKPPPLTIDGTVLKESVDLDIWGVPLDSKLIFEKHLCSIYRAASQNLVS